MAFGLEISRKSNRILIISALGALFCAFIFGVFKGPPWMAVFSGIGIVFSLLNALFHMKEPERYPGWGASLSFLMLNLAFLVSAVALQGLFLSRLSNERLNIPPLVSLYQSPDKSFSVKLPAEWRHETLMGPEDSGLRLSPDGFDNYMGAAEIQIRVRPLTNPPLDQTQFLIKFASSVAPKEREPKKETAFSFSVQPGHSIKGRPGVWAFLEVSRFWIPIRQTTYFGIKNHKFLCTITVTGLKAHDTLHQVLCLGLFETIKPTSKSS